MKTPKPVTCSKCGAVCPPPPPGQGGEAGYARLRNGRKVCYACADAMEREALKTADKFCAYLSRDKSNNRLIVTTWTGGLLARTTSERKGSVGGFCRNTEVIYFTAEDVNGQAWHGRGTGEGMYCTMHKNKNQRRKFAA